MHINDLYRSYNENTRLYADKFLIQGIFDTVKRYFFKNNQKLTRPEQFRAALAHKCCSQRDLIRLYVVANDCGYPRLGISVGRKQAGAVGRNRLKRLSREAFRLCQHDIPAGYDYLLIFVSKRSKKKEQKPQIASGAVSFEAVRQSLCELAETAVQKSRQRSQDSMEKASGE